MKKRTIILTFIVFIFALSARYYWFSQKAGIHTDEAFTVIVSQNNEYGFIKYFDEAKTYDGKTLKEITFGADNSVKGVLKSLKSLRYHNNGDTPNTNLYYSLFRISQIGVNSTDIKQIFQRDFYLNLILFSLSFFFMFKLINLLHFEKKYIPFILLVAYLNTGSISMSIFARYYTLQEFAFVLLAYIFTYLYKSEKIQNLRNLFKIAISSAITLLSGYFGLIYTGILGVVLLIKKQEKLFLLSSFLVGLIITFLFYPNYLDFIYAPRVGLSDHSLFSNLTQTPFTSFMFYSFQILWNYLFYGMIVLLLVFTLLKEKKVTKDKYLWTLIIINFICYIVFFLFAPQKVLRYTEPLFPILSLIIPAIILITDGKLKNILISLVSVVFIFNTIFPNKFESYDSMINPPRLSLTRGVIENSFTETDCSILTNSQVPIFVTEKNGWNIINIIPYFKDTQAVKIDYSENPAPEYNHVILLFTEKSLIVPQEMKILKEFSCQRFKGFEISKD